MSVSETAVRGSIVRLRGSLRTRVIAACALLLVAIGFVLCLVLPRSFEQVARESLRERTTSMARGAAFHIGSASDDAALESTVRWLSGEPDFESAALVGHSGRILAVRPEGSAAWRTMIPSGGQIMESADHFVAIVSLREPGEAPFVAVRTSTTRLRGELASVVGLFSALLLLTSAAFFVLTSYLVRAVLNPLDEIRLAAQHLADGERDVHVLPSGDAEIDELGQLISTLGAVRRDSASGGAAAPAGDPAPIAVRLTEGPS